VRRTRAWWTAVLAGAALATGAAGEAAAAWPVAQPGKATITRTAHDIPTITARDFASGGYGVGYAMAEDNICTMADTWLTLRAERAKHFGPAAADSDLYYAYVNRTAPLQEMLDAPPPHGPTQDTMAMLDGFIAGYNAYLEHVGVDGIDDPRCRGRAWVTPITRLDVMRRIYDLIGYAGRDLVRAGQMAAAPPAPGTPAPTAGALGRLPIGQELVRRALPGKLDDPVQSANVVRLAQAFADRVQDGGSNAVGFGGEATDNGSGALLANPHWTWDGKDRFYQFHLDIEGKMHTSGMGFLGQPLTMIGHNDNVAWSHTVSASRRLAIAEVQLVPGRPTTYLLDGVPREMDRTTVTVDVREADGSMTRRSKTFYSTVHGPVTTAVLGIPVLPWTPASAYSLVDMNSGSARIMNQFMESNQSRTVDELYAAHAKYAGNPWATTTAADDRGDALFTDVGTVPNISNQHAAACNTPLGHALWNTLGLAVLRGSQSSCAVPTDRTSPAPMTMPANRQPVIKRRDYVSNSNESHWLTNARQPLEGYSRVFGPERSQRAMRTRVGHRIVLDRLEGRDGAGKRTFGRQDIQDAVFNNRQMLAELWVDDLVAQCRAQGRMPGSSGPVDVSQACDVLAKYDRTDNLDSPGAVLFKRFADLSMASNDFLISYAGANGAPMWRTPYMPGGDPVNTPSGLGPAWAPAQVALADAVTQLREAGIPLDATLRDFQRTTYGGRSAPLHGGDGTLGLFNALSTRWNGKGYTAGGSGPSFVMVTSFGDGCPDDRSLLLGSQRSQHSGWAHAADQVALYAEKRWVDPPFCADEVARAAKRSVTHLDARGAVAVTRARP
jgi:acyl-homoserine-lactone acylase